jgi:hypothetical protein
MNLRATYGKGLSFSRHSPAMVGVRKCSTRTNAIQIAGEMCVQLALYIRCGLV